jgi:hypothetical protein
MLVVNRVYGIPFSSILMKLFDCLARLLASFNFSTIFVFRGVAVYTRTDIVNVNVSFYPVAKSKQFTNYGSKWLTKKS